MYSIDMMYTCRCQSTPGGSTRARTLSRSQTLTCILSHHGAFLPRLPTKLQSRPRRHRQNPISLWSRSVYRNWLETRASAIATDSTFAGAVDFSNKCLSTRRVICQLFIIRLHLRPRSVVVQS